MSGPPVGDDPGIAALGRRWRFLRNCPSAITLAIRSRLGGKVRMVMKNFTKSEEAVISGGCGCFPRSKT